MLRTKPPTVALLNKLHLVGVLLELLGELVHLLGSLEEALSLGQVAYLFLGRTLSNLLDLIDLVLSFSYRAHLDARVIIVVDAAEVGGKLLIKDIGP